MTRLQLDPNKSFEEAFKKLRLDYEEIKNRQNSGRDIWIPKIVECLDIDGNPTVYDLVAVDDGSGNVLKSFIVTFTADHQEETFAVPSYRMYIFSPGTDPADGDVFGISTFYEPGLGPYTYAHDGTFGNNVFLDTRSVYLKVYFYATDTGTVTVEATS